MFCADATNGPRTRKRCAIIMCAQRHEMILLFAGFAKLEKSLSLFVDENLAKRPVPQRQNKTASMPEISARKFADKYNGGSLIVYKVLRSDMTHFGHTYMMGPNRDAVAFNPTGVCEVGGMSFCVGEPENVASFLCYGTQVGTFELDASQSRVYVALGNYDRLINAKTDFFNLRKVEPLKDFFANFTEHQCSTAVCLDPRAIEYLSDAQRTPEICLDAVNDNGNTIEYLSDAQRTLEVRLAAVREEKDAIRYLTDIQRTPEVCRAASHM